MVAWNKTLSDSPLVASVRDLGVQFLDNDINISGQEPPEHKSTQRLWAIHGTHQNGSLYLWGSVQPEEKSSGEMYLARVRPSR